MAERPKPSQALKADLLSPMVCRNQRTPQTKKRSDPNERSWLQSASKRHLWSGIGICRQQLGDFPLEYRKVLLHDAPHNLVGNGCIAVDKTVAKRDDALAVRDGRGQTWLY